MYGNRQLAYAPTPYSYTPQQNLSTTIPLDQEVTLESSTAERELYDSLAEIYSVIVTLDALEKAFVKDSIATDEYTEVCDRLLKQYKTLLGDDTILVEFGDLDTFMRKWGLESQRARERIRIGFPGTVVEQPVKAPGGAGGAGVGGNNGPDATAIVEATQDFITFLDALKLNLYAKDSLHPILSDVIQSVNKVTDRDFDGRGKIVQWLITLNQMKATQEITEDQARELVFDMEQAYQGFKATLR